MRLIDADLLLSEVNKKCNNMDNAYDVVKIITDQPIAFDREKVIKKMKDSQRYYEEISDNAFTLGKVAGIYECIQIIEKGGLNANN